MKRIEIDKSWHKKTLWFCHEDQLCPLLDDDLHEELYSRLIGLLGRRVCWQLVDQLEEVAFNETN